MSKRFHISSKLLLQFTEMYGNIPGVLHIEYGGFLENQIIVFFDSFTLKDQLPFEFGSFKIHLYDVRSTIDDLGNILKSLNPADKDKNIRKHIELFDQAHKLCDGLLDGSIQHRQSAA